MQKSSIPKNSVKIAEEAMKDILPKVRFAIATASGAVLDAIAFGLPIIRIRQDIDLNIDPMDWFSNDELQSIARTQKEIENEINRILALRDEEFRQLKDSGRKLIEKCFFPVTEETLAVFIN